MDRRTKRKKTKSYDIAKFLRYISEPGEVVYIFIKSKNTDNGSNHCGYYEESRFDQIAEDLNATEVQASGVYYTINPLDISRLAQVGNNLQATSNVKSPKASDIVRRRLLLIDVDPIREPDCSVTTDEKLEAKVLANQVFRDLKEAGWPKPIMVDSGNGYHLLYKIDLPTVDGGLVQSCLKALAIKYDNDKVKIDTKVHDTVRLAKLPGTLACKGNETPERPYRRSGFFRLPDEFQAVSKTLLTELAAQAPQKLPKKNSFKPNINRVPNAVSVPLARAYLAKMDPAISGENGRNQFFNAACRLVDDFALPAEQAKPLLEEYNLRCIPPFNDRELDDKLSSALAKVAEQGGPTGSALPIKEMNQPSVAKRFLGYISDFGLTSFNFVNYTLTSKFDYGHWINVYYIWKLQNSVPLIPDVMLRQLIFGANFDRNWRARLPKKLKLKRLTKEYESNKSCNVDTCTFFATGVKHLHYFFNLDISPVLSKFTRENCITSINTKKILVYENEFKELRMDFQKKGILFNVYWPALIFGSSPKVGWTWPQQRLVVGMVRELTRAKTKQGEGITGEIIQGALVSPVTNSDRPVSCPILDKKKNYVTFAGNGRRKGQGYKIVGRTGSGWLRRVGYHDAPNMDMNQKLEAMRSFLTDLDKLSKELGLIPIGVYQGEWKCINQMMDCLRNGSGQDWLNVCTLRIFAQADWRRHWRQYFSDKLGFEWIPENPEDVRYDINEHQRNNHGGFMSSHEIRLFLKDQGWSQKRLAEEITKVTGQACSVRRVERQLVKNGPHPKFLKEVDIVRNQYTSPTS